MKQHATPEHPLDFGPARVLCEKHGLQYIKEAAELLGPGLDRFEKFLVDNWSDDALLKDFKVCKLFCNAASRRVELSMQDKVLLSDDKEAHKFLKANLGAEYEKFSALNSEDRAALLDSRKEEYHVLAGLISTLTDFMDESTIYFSKETSKIDWLDDISSYNEGLGANFWRLIMKPEELSEKKQTQLQEQISKHGADCDLWARLAKSGPQYLTHVFAAQARFITIMVHMWFCKRTRSLREMKDASIKDFVVRLEQHIPVTIPKDRDESRLLAVHLYHSGRVFRDIY